ncbi:MAG: endonuclease/exonuclease/phosphatase family protein [Anaerolineae bacterium]|nr:endonuclease/exonuclease/phosphatase family protein [Anaerolineae bacterium]
MISQLPSLTVLSYNIKAGQHHPDSLEAVAQVIEALHPDIVALQEVDVVAHRTHWVHQPAWLGQRLSLRDHFGAALQLPDGGQYGVALLTRWPVERAQVYSLPKPPQQGWQARGFGWAGQQVVPDWLWNRVKRTRLLPWMRRLNPYFAAEPRCLLATTLHSPWGPLHVLVTHWGLQAEERLAQARATLRIIDEWASGRPLVLAGDFNAQPDSPEIALLRSWLVDAAQAVGLTGEARLTFPSGPRGARTPDLGWAGAIDYIFVRGLTPQAVRVAYDETRASDHQPLVAELRVNHDPHSGH